MAADVEGRGMYFVYVSFAIASLGGLTFGYHYGVISGSMIQIKKEIELNDVWHQLIVGIMAGAAALFALLSGPVADRFGRKPVIMFSAVAYTFGALLMACAQNAVMLLFGRLFIGAGLGSATMVIPIYIAESTPSNVRGCLLTAYMPIVSGGQLLGSIIAGAMSYVAQGWRYMIGLACVPPALQFFAFFFLPESPTWLSENKFRNMSKKQVENDSPTKNSLIAIVHKSTTRKALIVGCILQIMQQSCGFCAVVFYTASIMQMAGIEDENTAIWLAAVVSAINFLANFVSVYLVEKSGRRPLMLWNLFGVGISALILGVGFYVTTSKSPLVTISHDADYCSLKKTCSDCTSDSNCGYCFVTNTNVSYAYAMCMTMLPHNNETFSPRYQCSQMLNTSENLVKLTLNYCPSTYSWIPISGVIIYIIFFASGVAAMPWTINAEMYPQWARSMGNALATFLNWSINLLVSMTFLSITSSIGKDGAFFLYACISFCGFIILFFSLPETKGSTLDNVETRFQFPFFKNGLQKFS